MTVSENGNRLGIGHPQVRRDAAAAIEHRAIDLARIQRMFGRQQMGEGPKAIAGGQLRHRTFDGHRRLTRRGAPVVAVADRQ